MENTMEKKESSIFKMVVFMREDSRKISFQE